MLGKLGKNPLVRYFNLDAGYQVLGVVIIKIPFLFKCLLQSSRKSSGLPKCSSPSQETTASYLPNSLGNPLSKSCLINLLYPFADETKRSTPSKFASLFIIVFNQPSPQGASRIKFIFKSFKIFTTAGMYDFI